MDWSAVGAAAIGALLALSGTVAGDLLRGRRERVQDDTQQRRSAYVDYLEVLSAVHGKLRALARTGLTGEELQLASREAFGSENLFEIRERFLLAASPAVLAPAQQALLSLRAVRDAIGAGAALGSPEYHEAYHPHSDHIWRLRSAFRADLGVATFSPDQVLKADWSSRNNCVRCRALPEVDHEVGAATRRPPGT